MVQFVRSCSPGPIVTTFSLRGCCMSPLMYSVTKGGETFLDLHTCCHAALLHVRSPPSVSQEQILHSHFTRVPSTRAARWMEWPLLVARRTRATQCQTQETRARGGRTEFTRRTHRYLGRITSRTLSSTSLSERSRGSLTPCPTWSARRFSSSRD